MEKANSLQAVVSDLPLLVGFHECLSFSRLRSRRVPVFKLGSRGPGGDARSLRCVRKAFASVRNRSQRVGHAEETKETKIVAKRRTCRHFLRFVLQKYQQSQGSGGSWSRSPELNPRTVVTFGRVSGLRVSTVSHSHRDRGRRGRRNPELSSLLDSSRLFASQKCQQSQESGGSWSRNPELNPRTVVTFAFASGERKGERREEKREMRGEKRREEIGEKKRGERREETG